MKSVGLSRHAKGQSIRNRVILSTMRAAKLMHRFVAATSAAFVMFCSPLAAQDLEPRAYSNSPIGLHFVLVGYAYSTGKLLTDPSLPVENVSIASHVGVLGGATVVNVLGQSAKLELVIPYVELGAKGEVFGIPHARYIDGLGDPLFRFSMNFIGAPAHGGGVLQVPAEFHPGWEHPHRRPARPVR